jgi:Tfp pilus assembly ATPase PilU
MQAGGATGMQTMDSALMTLVKKDIISGQEAYQQANNKEKFRAVRDDADDPDGPNDPDDPDDPLDEEFLPALGQ